MREDYSNIYFHRLKWAYLLSLVAILICPVFYVIYISFNEHGFGARIYTFTLDWYLVVLGDKPLVASLKWTLYLAIATVLSVIPMSLLYAKLYKKTQKKLLLIMLMLLPLFVPPDIMASSLLVFFKNLNNFFEILGNLLGLKWITHWFELGFLTAVIGQIIYTMPYAFIVILITMSRYREQQSEAARSCGATAWQAFWQIEFPQIRVGVFSACAFVTILSFNEAVRTALLKGGFDTFSTVLNSQMMNVGMSGESYAMASIMSIIAMLVIGSTLIYSLVHSERLERLARAKAKPLLS